MRALTLAVLVLTAVLVSSACAAGGPEERLARHWSDSALLGSEAPTPVRATAFALPSDVSREHWTVTTPADALGAGLLGPAADGRFHPSRLVTRQELLDALRRLDGIVAASRLDSLRVPALSALAGEAVAPQAAGLATRRDLARALAGALTRFTPSAAKLRIALDGASETFFDMPSGDPAFRAVMAARELGFVRGWEDGGYHPDAFVTRAELAESLVWSWDWLRTL